MKLRNKCICGEYEVDPELVCIRCGVQRLVEVSVDDLYMEDVNQITGEATKLITQRLFDRRVIISDEQENAVYEAIQREVEKLTGYPSYRHEH